MWLVLSYENNHHEEILIHFLEDVKSLLEQALGMWGRSHLSKNCCPMMTCVPFVVSFDHYVWLFLPSSQYYWNLTHDQCEQKICYIWQILISSACLIVHEWSNTPDLWEGAGKLRMKANWKMWSMNWILFGTLSVTWKLFWVRSATHGPCLSGIKTTHSSTAKWHWCT